MGTDQYHEPANELSAEIRTFARMITGLIEEAEAIGWYEQRLSLEKDKQAHSIMENAQKENSSISEWISSFFYVERRNGGIYLKLFYSATAISLKQPKRRKSRPNNEIWDTVVGTHAPHAAAPYRASGFVVCWACSAA
jgi:hypothetical protein